MSNIKYIPIINEHDCLTEQQMFDYIDNKLSSAEMHLAEKHMLDCELCSDAVEGLALIKNRSVVEEVRNSITEKTQINAPKRSKVILLWREHKTKLAIAASLIIVTCIMVILRYSIVEENEKVFTENFINEKNIEVTPAPEKQTTVIEKETAREDVQANKKQDDAPETIKKDVIELQDEGKTYVEDTKQPAEDKNEYAAAAADDLEETPVSTESKNISAPVAAAERKAEMDDESIQLTSTESDKSLKVKAFESFSKKKSANKSAAPSIASTMTTQQESMSLARAEQSPKNDSDFVKGMRFYSNENFTEAISSFEKHLQRNPNNGEALIYSSISYLKQEKANEALILLNRLLNISSNYTYFEAANYYKALAKVKKNDKREAKAILKQIIQDNGEYKQKATDLLNDLD